MVTGCYGNNPISALIHAATMVADEESAGNKWKDTFPPSNFNWSLNLYLISVLTVGFTTQDIEFLHLSSSTIKPILQDEP